jgi:hypothetical protein
MSTPAAWLVRAGRGAEHVEHFIAGGFVSPTGDLVFGEAVGDYEFRESPVLADHRHVRRVKWLGRWNRDIVEDIVGTQTRYYQRTVLELSNQREWLLLADRVRTGEGEAAERPTRPPRRGR